MAWLALTSSSAAARDRGGRLRTPSNSGEELGTRRLAPKAGSAHALDQLCWWRNSWEPAGARGLLQGSMAGRRGGGQGARWRRCVHLRHSAPAPWGSAPPPPFSGNPGAVSSAAQMWTWHRGVKHPHLCCHLPTCYQDWTGRASPLSHLLQQQLRIPPQPSIKSGRSSTTS